MNKIPKWFYLVSAIALLWNLIGLLAVGQNLFVTPEQLALLSEQQQTLHKATPTWTVVASLIAVLTGCLGCIGLLLKKAWSQIILVISVVALIVQDIGIFVVVNGVELAGGAALVMQIIVLIIACALVLLAKKAKRNSWIN